MKKIYNIVLNSSNGNGTDTKELKYFFNWSQIPEGNYKLIANFMSGIFTTTNVSLCQIFINLDQQDTFFASNPYSTTSQAYSSTYIGTCNSIGTGVESMIYLDNNNNIPISINGRPSNNLLTVQLLNNDATKTPYTDPITSYSLTLTLELLD